MRTSGLCRWGVVGVSAWIVTGVCGCAMPAGGGAAGRRGPTNAASRLLANVDISDVHPVADRVFRQYFRVDPEASSPSVLVSRPVEITHPAQRQRVRDVLRPSPNRRRQVTQLHLIPDGPHVLVRCRVLIQRLDTAERAAFTRERGDDRPTDTPIDRRGASAVSAREEWVNVGRDRTLEREILTAIQRELTRATRPAS